MTGRTVLVTGATVLAHGRDPKRIAATVRPIASRFRPA
jgi:hypothetical protein